MRGGHKPRALVVGGNAGTRVVVRWVPERRGRRAVEAAGGRAAYELTVERRPGLVVMGLSMPGADGHEAIRCVGARGEIAGLPVIAVTASDRAASRGGAAEAGFGHYLSSPIDFERPRVLAEQSTRTRRKEG